MYKLNWLADERFNDISVIRQDKQEDRAMMENLDPVESQENKQKRVHPKNPESPGNW